MARPRVVRVAVLVAVLVTLSFPSSKAAIANDAPLRGKVTIEKTIEEVLGPQTDPPVSRFSFELYVPDSYDPARPAGLLVYISPTRSGAPPPRFNKVFEDRNIIWISVNEAGNYHKTGSRIIEAIASLQYAMASYAIDPRRLYLSGFSGGGRVTSIFARLYPQYFNGYIYIGGVNRWNENPFPNLAAMQQSRYVFLTGSQDINRIETQNAFRDYQRAGFDKIKLIDIRGMSHTLPRARTLASAIGFLDGFAAGSIDKD